MFSTGTSINIATTFPSAIPPVKREREGAMQGEADIKPKLESCGVSPKLQSEEDVYEDTGDLDFTNSAQEVYLTRLPKFLWSTWSQLDDDVEVNLGSIRVEGDLENPRRMSLLLSSDVENNHNVPKEYNMQLQTWTPANTFIFTEQDLPGYLARAKNATKHMQDSASMPFSQVAPRLGFQYRTKQVPAKFDKTKKWQPYYKKAIPKKTSIAGKVSQEITCLPVENQEYRLLMDERTRQAITSKKETQFVVDSDASNALAPGTLGASGNFDNFIKTTGPQRSRAQDYKAARMPQNELIDIILDCFKRYNYWSLKSLKSEVNQPESYLKQTLEKVAHLVRQGPHAMTWQLNQENKIGAYADALAFEQVQDKVAPDTSYQFDGASDTGEGIGTEEDNDTMKLEDVV
ncbi:hypothetical protein MMC13_007960 [Lambiella insularis]|nr:hypothetical protein [Lambiella insularis]